MVQLVLNDIATGSPVVGIIAARMLISGTQVIMTSFCDQSHCSILAAMGKAHHQSTVLDLSPGAWAVQQLVTKLCSGDPTGQTEIILNKLVQDVSGHELIENVFSEEVRDVHKIITKLCSGDPTGQTEIIFNKLVHEVSGHEEIVNKISLGTQQIQALQQTISGDGIKSIQNVLMDLAAKDTASGVQIILQSIEYTQVHFHV